MAVSAAVAMPEIEVPVYIVLKESLKRYLDSGTNAKAVELKLFNTIDHRTEGRPTVPPSDVIVMFISTKNPYLLEARAEIFERLMAWISTSLPEDLDWIQSPIIRVLSATWMDGWSKSDYENYFVPHVVTLSKCLPRDSSTLHSLYNFLNGIVNRKTFDLESAIVIAEALYARGLITDEPLPYYNFHTKEVKTLTQINAERLANYNAVMAKIAVDAEAKKAAEHVAFLKRLQAYRSEPDTSYRKLFVTIRPVRISTGS